jgi:phenylalanine-4-hydroxylase
LKRLVDFHSFDDLFSLVGDLERWMKEGKLNNVAPGEPKMGEQDVRSFLHASEGT